MDSFVTRPGRSPTSRHTSSQPVRSPMWSRGADTAELDEQRSDRFRSRRLFRPCRMAGGAVEGVGLDRRGGQSVSDQQQHALPLAVLLNDRLIFCVKATAEVGPRQIFVLVAALGLDKDETVVRDRRLRPRGKIRCPARRRGRRGSAEASRFYSAFRPGRGRCERAFLPSARERRGRRAAARRDTAAADRLL